VNKEEKIADLYQEIHSLKTKIALVENELHEKVITS